MFFKRNLLVLVPVAAANVTAPNEISASSKCETNKPPTVEQIEKLQFLVLEKVKYLLNPVLSANGIDAL